MPKYALTLFGGFELRDDRGEPVTIAAKKGRCLLACLALAQGQAIPRDRLAGLLWGDRDDTHARHSLSQALYRLRGLFPEDIQAGFDLSTDTVALSAYLLDVDALRFENGLDAADPASKRAALEIYEGDLLAGLTADQEGFDGWLVTERERLRDRGIAGWRDLIEAQTNAAPEQAIQSAKRLLKLEPADEEGHRALMALYAKSGRRDLAVRQYDKCRDALSTELGIEPDQQTKALRRLIETEPAAPPEKPQRAAAESEEAHAPSSGAAERRQITVLECDLVIATPDLESLDPEDRGGLVDAARDLCTEIVRRYGGAVMRPVDDGFVACFGFPQAHEDDPVRAAHAGLGMVAALKNMEPKGQLAARVGIATGLVIVGPGGSAGVAELQSITGEAVNRASHLRHSAEPSTVLVSESTQRLLDTSFEISEYDAPNGASAWRVAAHGPVESRFEARSAGVFTAFVGREEEIYLLNRRWSLAKEGDGQVVLISGEPGIGKSRLAQMFHERIADEPHVRLRHQCSPHHRNSALFPMSTQLAFAAGFAEGDSTTAKLDKLETLLGQATDKVSVVAPLFADLLSIPYERRYPPLDLTPQAQLARTLDALNDQLIGLAAKQPVLAVFEDLHWIDPTTQELLDLMVERVRQSRVLALFTFRPEYQAPWVGQPHVALMALSRLTQGESIELVRAVAADAALDAETVEAVAERADGVPLFMEELARALLEGGATGTIPATIQASLLARFDRLGLAKEVAQVGAVLGREFDYCLLAALSDLDEASLGERLDALAASQLVLTRGTPPEASYTFKHALVQDAVYESILKSRRKTLHARVAAELSARSPGFAETQPEILAHHYTEAGLAEEGVEHWLLAAELASGLSANEEAVNHARRGIALLGDLADDMTRKRRELGLQNVLGNALIPLRSYSAPETGEAFSRAFELCRELDDRDRVFPVLVGLHGYHDIRGELLESKKVGETAYELAERQNDPTPMITALFLRGTNEHMRGNQTRAIEYLDRLEGLYDIEGPGIPISLYSEETGLCGLSVRCTTLWDLGFPDKARALAEATVAQAREVNHAWTTVFTLYWASVVYRECGDFQSYRAAAEEAYAQAHDQRHRLAIFTTRYMKAHASLVLDGDEAGVEEMARVATSMAELGLWCQPSMLTILAAVYGERGRRAEGLELCERAAGIVQQTHEREYEPEIHRTRGALTMLQAEGDEDQAEQHVTRALELARDQDAKSFELRAACDLARLWHARGEIGQARDLLGQIYGWFTEGFSTPDLKAAKALLDQLS